MTDTVNILGMTYDVVRVPYIAKDEFVLAHIDYVSQRIQIDESLTAERSDVALLHEIIHGILFELRCNDENADERLVHGLATSFYRLLADNPQLFNNQRRRYMNKRQTSKPVASKASKLLADGRTSAKVKSVAGSALSQTRTGKSKRGAK